MKDNPLTQAGIGIGVGMAIFVFLGMIYRLVRNSCKPEEN